MMSKDLGRLITLFFYLLGINVCFSQEFEVRLPSGHTMAVNEMVISPDNKLLLTASGDQTVKLWEIRSMKMIKSFEDFQGSVNDIKWMNGGETFIASSDDSLLTSYDVSSFEVLNKWKFTARVTQIELKDDSTEIFVSTSDGQLYNLKSKSNEFKKISIVKLERIGHFNVINDTVLSVIGFDENFNRFVEVIDLKRNKRLFLDSVNIYDFVLSHNNGLMLIYGKDKLSVLNLKDLSVKMIDKYSPNEVVFISGTDRFLAFGKNGFGQWDAVTGKLIYYKNWREIDSWDISSNGKYFLTCEGTYVSLWDIHTGVILNVYNWFDYAPQSVYFNINNKSFFTSKNWNKSEVEEFDLWSKDKLGREEIDINHIVQRLVNDSNLPTHIKEKFENQDKLLGIYSSIHRTTTAVKDFYLDDDNTVKMFLDSSYFNISLNDLHVGKLSQENIKEEQWNSYSYQNKSVTANLKEIDSINSEVLLLKYPGTDTIRRLSLPGINADLVDENYFAGPNTNDPFIFLYNDYVVKKGEKSWFKTAKKFSNGKYTSVRLFKDINVYGFNTPLLLSTKDSRYLSVNSEFGVNVTQALDEDDYFNEKISGNHIVQVIDFNKRKSILTFLGKRDSIQPLVFHFYGKDEGFLIKNNGFIEFHKLGKKEKIQEIKVADEFSEYEIPNVKIIGAKAIITGQNGNLLFIDLMNKTLINQFNAHTETVSTFEYHDSSDLLLTAAATAVKIWRGSTLTLISEIEFSAGVKKAEFSMDGSFVTVATEDGEFAIVLVSNGKKILSHYFFDRDPQTSIWKADEFYMANKDGLKNIYFTNEHKIYSFDQFDLQYNRPDKVYNQLRSINSEYNLEKEKVLNEAYKKRVLKYKINFDVTKTVYSIPEGDFNNKALIPEKVSTGKINIDFTAKDSIYKLVKFNVWINDVPVYGSEGKVIDISPSSIFSVSELLSLDAGKNKIEAAVYNEQGISSFREPLIIYSDHQVPAPKTYFIGIGIDKFNEPGHDLSYSVKDLRDLSKMLKDKLGNQIIIDTLFNQNVGISEVQSLKNKLMQTQINDKVIICYSGHGLLNDNYDYFLSSYNVDFENPENGGIPYEVLENLLDSIPARKKLLLIDACHSGEVDKEGFRQMNDVAGAKGIVKPKGGDSENTNGKAVGLQNSFELMQELFVNVQKGSGATIISAAAGDQFALEGGKIENGFFTYAILKYMQENKQVSISALKKYVYAEVEKLSGGLQKPTSRIENLEMDWKIVE